MHLRGGRTGFAPDPRTPKSHSSEEGKPCQCRAWPLLVPAQAVTGTPDCARGRSWGTRSRAGRSKSQSLRIASTGELRSGDRHKTGGTTMRATIAEGFGARRLKQSGRSGVIHAPERWGGLVATRVISRIAAQVHLVHRARRRPMPPARCRVDGVVVAVTTLAVWADADAWWADLLLGGPRAHSVRLNRRKIGTSPDQRWAPPECVTGDVRLSPIYVCYQSKTRRADHGAS